MHALVVGGTGMLKDVALWLNRSGWTTTVVARRTERMDALLAASDEPENVTPVLVDWHDGRMLARAVREAARRNGPYALVVWWMHASAADSEPWLLRAIGESAAATWRLFHVKGSRASLPGQNRRLPLGAGGLYREVILGFQLESDGTSRWLTHQEIAGGVIAAIERDDVQTIVGRVDPWDQRPV